MSAVTPKADIQRVVNVRFVPIGDMVPYSITSSARASSVGGTVSPSALAVLRLMIISNLVGCWTGNSEAFAPRRMRST